MCRKGRSKSIDAPIVPMKFAAAEQERDICERRGHDKECADHNNESRVFASSMLHAGGAVEGEGIIAARCRGQERT